MQAPVQSWSIIIFCYNEEHTIASVFNSVFDLLKRNSVPNFEVVIVDDGSTDGSVEKIKHLQSEFPEHIKIFFHQKNKGIGYALRAGYNLAQYENISAVPADGQFDVKELLPYLNVPEKTFISFYRKENLQYTLFRNILSYLNKKINYFFIGISLKDVNWVKIYKTKEIRKFPWKIKSSLIESEICAKLLRNGNKVQEVISVYHPRKAGESKGASIKILLQAMKETIKLIFIMLGYRRKPLQE